jgi:hypothetical protein
MGGPPFTTVRITSPAVALSRLDSHDLQYGGRVLIAKDLDRY